MNKKIQGTEPSDAPVILSVEAPVIPAPRQRTIERQGSRSEPYTIRLPQIRGGVCEFCGTIDPLVPPQFQYQLCPHFRGLGEMRCSYCDESKNPTEVIGHSRLNIAGHPDNPDKLVVWCDSYECSRKHEARFKRSN